VSRASTHASAKPSGANDVVFDLQCRTRDYVAKTLVEKQELTGVKEEIRKTMKYVCTEPFAFTIPPPPLFSHMASVFAQANHAVPA